MALPPGGGGPVLVFDPDSPPILTGMCPTYARFFGLAGAALATVLSAYGAAYATAKSGTGLAMCGIQMPSVVMRGLLPVILAGMIVISGLIVSIIISTEVSPLKPYSLFSSMVHLGGGLAVGLTGMSAGYAIGNIGNIAIRALTLQPKFFLGMMLLLIMCEVLGIYGLIIGIMMSVQGDDSVCLPTATH